MRSLICVLSLFVASTVFAQGGGGDPTMEPAANEIAWAGVCSVNAIIEVGSTGQSISNQWDREAWLWYQNANPTLLNSAGDHLDAADGHVDDAMMDWVQGEAHISTANAMMVQGLYSAAFTEATHAIFAFGLVYPDCLMAMLELDDAEDDLDAAENAL